MRYVICVVAAFLTLFTSTRAQSPNATLNGQVVDSSGGGIAGANVDAVNVATNIKYSTKTNGEGMYLLPDLPPANYEIQVSHTGFKTIVKPDVLLNVRDAVVINFTLPLGAVSERVTVEGGAPLINTESAAVSTVVDRQFAENLPMNGRSFQTLVQLTPGVVLTVSSATDAGQFSVNGQRASSNYWMVDGVSANIGVSPNGATGDGFGGALGSFSVQGGTNSLVSVDALQEFRIQTSTYAPEFGRTPGGQISIVTRSGTNGIHGALFDYFRNDALDANDWFANANHLSKPAERQNDFGGTFSGPILKDGTFFFLSYEGLRLRLPQTALTTVPDVTARQNASSALQPYLNAYPLPNGMDNPAIGIAQFNASFSNKSTLDAYSLRVDHKLTNRLMVFGRYNYSPSELDTRGGVAASLSRVWPTQITTQTVTAGTTWSISTEISNDLRLNYSRSNASSYFYQDDFGGAVPVASLPFPTPFTSLNALVLFRIFSLQGGTIEVGQNTRNVQRQWNLVESTSLQKGPHNVKFGVDYRRLSPSWGSLFYSPLLFFSNVTTAESGTLRAGSAVRAGTSATFLFNNLGVFAQDTWRLLPRLTVVYGLRWDVDFAPSSNPSLPAVTGFNVNDFSQLALAASGTSVFKTPYRNFAPRIGIAYQLGLNQGWQTVVRGGFGVFFDLATQEIGNGVNFGTYPFGATKRISGTFPLSPATAAPPPITAANLSSSTLYTFDPNLRLPYTLQWNLALEQALGTHQSISASYIGSAGRRLMQSEFVFAPNASFANAQLVTNAATSDYTALQIQYQRRMWRGLQILSSYTLAHSIDSASAGSVFGNQANDIVPSLNPNTNRGPSDFDIRNAFSAGVTYDLPAPKPNAFMSRLLTGWSVQNVIQARSAPPVNVYDAALFELFNANAAVRPDVVPGQPFYVLGSQYPGGKAINPAAFKDPPKDVSGNPLREGNLGRNALRGFGATQWDFAVDREFPIRESIKAQFRAEMFNVLNHPNFASPLGDISAPQNLQSAKMLGASLGQNPGGGSFSSLYQIGGPRSIQLALKLMF